MENDVKHKMYMGLRGFMIPIPKWLSARGLEKDEANARINSARLSNEERRVHHFIVKTMAVAEDPISAEAIASELQMPNDQVHEIIDKLENLKTYVYRSDGQGINWAYPFSLENTGFRMTASSGEKFFAA